MLEWDIFRGATDLTHYLVDRYFQMWRVWKRPPRPYRRQYGILQPNFLVVAPQATFREAGTYQDVGTSKNLQGYKYLTELYSANSKLVGPMAILSGKRLGPYEILSAIGAGGMGEVYKARDTRLDRIVAIKVLPAHLADRAELRERFEREAKTIASLNHPHICTLYDTGHQDGLDFLVMEYIEGETLAQRLVKGSLPIQQVLQYAIEIADALDKAHRKGITHRDLKPGNIMLTKSGTKLLDFGLAKLRQDSNSAPPFSELATIQGGETAEGTILGTLQYMAPEQVEGRPVDSRTDIFAFGAVVYEMTTGKKAFEGRSQASLIAKILEIDPPPISSIQPMTPAALDRVVKRCLAKDPDERWQTARDLEVELEWIAEGSSQITPRAATPAPKMAARIVPWAIAALFALALGGLLFLSKSGKPNVQYTTVIYREGILEAARFSHDGQTIVYSGEWEGNPRQISMYRVGSPESRDLGIALATVASVSSSDQLAVLRNCEPIFVRLRRHFGDSESGRGVAS